MKKYLLLLVVFSSGCGIQIPKSVSVDRLQNIALNQDRETVHEKMGKPVKVAPDSDTYHLCSSIGDFKTFLLGIPTLTIAWFCPTHCLDYSVYYENGKVSDFQKPREYESTKRARAYEIAARYGWNP